MSEENSLFNVSPSMVDPKHVVTMPKESEESIHETTLQAIEILKQWWLENPDWTQTYQTVETAVLKAVQTRISPKTIKKRLNEHTVTQQKIYRNSLARKKPSLPKNSSTERNQLAQSIVKPWWVNYGDGWTQTYGQVYRVILSLLGNNVKVEDIKKAMMILTHQRMPFSNASIGYALSKTNQEVKEEEIFRESSSSRNKEKYTQRTL